MSRYRIVYRDAGGRKRTARVVAVDAGDARARFRREIGPYRVLSATRVGK